MSDIVVRQRNSKNYFLKREKANTTKILLVFDTELP